MGDPTLTVPASGPVQLRVSFDGGDGYVVVSEPWPGKDAPHAPVRLGSWVAREGYDRLISGLVQQTVYPNAVVQVLPSHCYMANALPVLELIHGNATMTEAVIAKGYAIPDASVLAQHVRSKQIIEALRDARANQRGFWGEDGAEQQAISLLGETLARDSQPAATPNPLIPFAIAMVVVLFFMIIVRDQKNRTAPMNKATKWLRWVIPVGHIDVLPALSRSTVPSPAPVPPPTPPTHETQKP